MVKHQSAMLACLSDDEQQQLCTLMDKLVIASPGWPQELWPNETEQEGILIMQLARTFRLSRPSPPCSAPPSPPALAQTLTIGVRAGPQSITRISMATGTRYAEALKHVLRHADLSGDKLQIQPRLALQLEDDRADRLERPPSCAPASNSMMARTSPPRTRSSPSSASPLSPARTRTDDLCPARQTGEIVDPPRSIRHPRTGAEPAQRLHPAVHRFAQGGRRPEQGQRQRGLQFRQGADRAPAQEFVSWMLKDQMVLERFDGYWGPRSPGPRWCARNCRTTPPVLRSSRPAWVPTSSCARRPPTSRCSKCASKLADHGGRSVDPFNISHQQIPAGQRQGRLAPAQEPAAGREGARGDRPRH
ncbi:hypothetical protein SCANM63S_00082 [Streptomyces canarius]